MNEKRVFESDPVLYNTVRDISDTIEKVPVYNFANYISLITSYTQEPSLGG